MNLSAHQFRSPSLLMMIEAALASSGLAVSRLIIEVTESVAFLDARETTHAMAPLKRLGVGIALDDFGTGYSSLSHLARLRPEIIKIDRSFVSPKHMNVDDDTLIEAIVSLGRKLNTAVLAEGIETPRQLHHLRHLGCQIGQGYLFSPAVSVDEIEYMLDRGVGNWVESLSTQPRLDFDDY